MKRAISLIVIIVMMTAILLTGCGTKNEGSTSETTKPSESTAATSAPEKKLEGKITFATNRTDQADGVLKTMASQFMEKNPGIKIEIEGISDPATIIKTRLAAGELPDISCIGIPTKEYSLYLEPLDDLGFTPDNSYFYSMGVGNDNKLYLVNSTITMDCVVYNKNVFKDCGIDKVPTTLDELYAACEKIKAKGIVPMATNFKEKWPLNFWTESFVKINSGNPNYISELADKDELISEGGLLDGLKVLKTFVDKGYTENDLMSTNWDGSKRDIAQGKMAMNHMATWFAAQVIEAGGKQEDLGVFPFPYPDNKGIKLSSDWKFGISKDSKSMDAAKEFFKFLFLEGNYAKSLGVVSSLKNVKVEDPFVNELLSYGVPVVEDNANSEKYTAINNKAQFQLYDVAQEYILSKNTDETVKKFNNKWAEARKAVE